MTRYRCSRVGLNHAQHWADECLDAAEERHAHLWATLPVYRSENERRILANITQRPAH
jgi:hypothetical protein